MRAIVQGMSFGDGVIVQGYGLPGSPVAPVATFAAVARNGVIPSRPSAGVLWLADATSVSPPHYETTAQEDVILALTPTALLVGSDAPSGVAATLYEIVDGGADTPVTLQDAPMVEGGAIWQRIRGLAAGKTYRLRVTFRSSGNVRAMTLVIECVE